MRKIVSKTKSRLQRRNTSLPSTLQTTTIEGTKISVTEETLHEEHKTIHEINYNYKKEINI
jgi:hypothetical protein